jgi:hypothetical protein
MDGSQNRIGGLGACGLHRDVLCARVMGYEKPDKGLGVKWEGNIIYQHLYNTGANNQKFVPVLMKDEDKGFIPAPLQGASYFAVDTEPGINACISDER